MTSSEMASVRKEIETMMENMFTDPRVSKQDIMNWQVKVIEARSEMVNNIKEQFGKKEGEMERCSDMEHQIQTDQLREKDWRD